MNEPTRKPIGECTPEEAEKQREYMRVAKARSRANRSSDKVWADSLKNASYMREYRKRIKESE